MKVHEPPGPRREQVIPVVSWAVEPRLASVPAALLRSRRLRISGSGAGSGSVSAIMAQIPVYMQMIADGRVTVPTRTFPLSQVTAGWAATADGGPRVVIVPG